jgi:phospholipid/cholesterol/gamma-HCH transport system substrate-binding protein
MIKISKEIKAFILVVFGLLMFIFGYNFLKGQSLLKSQKIIYTIYPEIEGLIPGAKITLNGLSIGSVTQADFLPGSTKILISMNIRGDINFSNQSKAVLYETGLIGGKAISIIPNFDSKKLVKTGDTLKSSIKPGFTELVNRQIAPLQEKIVSTLTSVDSLFVGVSNVLNADTQNNLKNTLENLSISLENINNASSVLAELLIANQDAFSNTMNNLNVTSENLSVITDSISAINFNSTIKKYETVANNINELLISLDKGEGSVGKFLKDNSLYNRLDEVSNSMNLLIKDLKQNPKRYVHFSIFGNKEKPKDE